MYLPRFARPAVLLVALSVLTLAAMAEAWPLYWSGELYSWWGEREFSWQDLKFSTPHQHYLRAIKCQSSKTIISLARKGGFGPGPYYDLTICGDGTVLYEGHHGVRVVGVRRSKISPAQVQRLVQAFLDLGFFELEDYRAQQTQDLPEAFNEEGQKIIKREPIRMREKAGNRLRKLISITVRGSLGEKLALVGKTERLTDVPKEDLLTIAFADKLIELIPEAAARANEIVDLSVREATSESAESYLEEACYCYFYGLSSACAIVCRSVLEEAIERRLSRRALEEWRQKQNDKMAEPTFGIVIRLAKVATGDGEWRLPQTAYKASDDVLQIGNRAAHFAPVSSEDDLKCLKGVRQALAAILAA
jgi:hypothetical protein